MSTSTLRAKATAESATTRRKLVSQDFGHATPVFDNFEKLKSFCHDVAGDQSLNELYYLKKFNQSQCWFIDGMRTATATCFPAVKDSSNCNHPNGGCGSLATNHEENEAHFYRG